MVPKIKLKIEEYYRTWISRNFVQFTHLLKKTVLVSSYSVTNKTVKML